jgi:hypothetical protein
MAGNVHHIKTGAHHIDRITCTVSIEGHGNVFSGWTMHLSARGMVQNPYATGVVCVVVGDQNAIELKTLILQGLQHGFTTQSTCTKPLHHAVAHGGGVEAQAAGRALAGLVDGRLLQRALRAQQGVCAGPRRSTAGLHPIQAQREPRGRRR